MVTEPQSEPSKKQRLVLIDGHSLVYRAFFALPSLTDREGRVVNAAYGFTSMLLLALQEHPDYVLASFDLGGRTFRHEELEQYKATRRPTPPELAPQFPLTRDIVRAFGIPIYEVQGVEADDVIGTLATQARELGLHSTIVTGDLDALQLVNDDVYVLTSKRGVSETILYTPDRVRQRYGLEPVQTVDLKGLVGDVSDNIPGIRGIGEKTAIKLIQEYGSVENLVANRQNVTPPKIKKLLDEFAEQALLSKRMATIVRDVDIKLDLSRGSARDYRPDAARTMLADLGFRSLAARVPTTWRDGSTMSAPPIFAPVTKAQGQLELATETTRQPSQSTLALESEPSEAVVIVREAAELDRLVAAFAAADRAGFQVITLDDVPRRGRVAALVIGLDDHAVYYAPLAHEQERCLDQPSKIGFNQKGDYLALRAHGIELGGIDWDLLVAAYLLNSGVRSPSLEALASDVLHRAIEGREGLFGSGKTAMTCDQVEIARAAAFFGERMRVMMQLVPKLQSELERLGNAELFRDLEMPLVPVLGEMELAGVSVDLPYLQQVSRELYEQLQRLDREIANGLSVQIDTDLLSSLTERRPGVVLAVNHQRAASVAQLFAPLAHDPQPEGVQGGDHPQLPGGDFPDEVARQRLDRRVREHVRARGQRAAHGVDVERVSSDAESETMRLLGCRARHLGIQQREAPVERQLHEPRARFAEPLHGRSSLFGRGQLQPVPVRAPALRRVPARRGEQRTREAHPQRRRAHRQRPLGLAEIEHRRDPSAQLGRRDLGHVPRDREVHVRVDERREQEQPAGVDGPGPGGRPARLAGDTACLDGQRRRTRPLRIEQPSARDPQLGREEERTHLSSVPHHVRPGLRAAGAC